jgi:hypothetical protein
LTVEGAVVGADIVVALAPLDAELLEGLSDETTREITRQALRLPEREREIVLGVVRQFAGRSEAEDGR